MNATVLVRDDVDHVQGIVPFVGLVSAVDAHNLVAVQPQQPLLLGCLPHQQHPLVRTALPEIPLVSRVLAPEALVHLFHGVKLCPPLCRCLQVADGTIGRVEASVAAAVDAIFLLLHQGVCGGPEVAPQLREAEGRSAHGELIHFVDDAGFGWLAHEVAQLPRGVVGVGKVEPDVHDSACLRCSSAQLAACTTTCKRIGVWTVVDLHCGGVR